MTKFDKAAVLSAQNAHDYDLEYNTSYHYIASLVLSSIGFALVSIVMALQLGLSQWGAKSMSAQPLFCPKTQNRPSNHLDNCMSNVSQPVQHHQLLYLERPALDVQMGRTNLVRH